MENIDVSVIIPTYNKKDFLEITLTALGFQTYPRDRFEVVVINDGSTDPTETLVSSLKTPYQINYTRQENRGRSAARNRGIEKAKGKTIIFIDDDCVPAPTFIESHMQSHSKDDTTIVLGYKYLTFFQMLPDSIPRKATLMETLNRHETLHLLRDVPVGTMLIHPQDLSDGFDRLGQLSYAGERERWEQAYETYTPQLQGFVLPWLLLTTANFSVSKRHCVDIGGFDEDFKGWGLEDFEFGYRLYKQGLRFVLDKASFVYRLVHWDNEIEDRVTSKVRNYIHFCQKHPDIEVYLHWRLSTRQLDIHTYNSLIRQYYKLQKRANSIAEDYYGLVKQQCQYYGWDIEYRRVKDGKSVHVKIDKAIC